MSRDQARRDVPSTATRGGGSRLAGHVLAFAGALAFLLAPLAGAAPVSAQEDGSTGR